MSRSHSDVRWDRARAITVVLLAVVLLALFLPQAPAAASGTPTVTVNPSTGLVDGQPVSVDLTNFPPNNGVGIIECPATATFPEECGRMTPPLTNTDGSGAAHFGYSVTRVIFTNTLGRVDCAQTACVIAAGNSFAAPLLASAPIGFLNTQLPPPPFSITLEGAHFLNSAAATIGARLTCDRSETIQVETDVNQPPLPVGGGTNGSSRYDYSCTAGADLHIFSDYLNGFAAGDMFAAFFLLVGNSSGGTTTVAAAVGTVAVQSEADTAAALRAALAGPDGDAVRTKLIDDLNWRINHNFLFRQVWNAAVCCQ